MAHHSIHYSLFFVLDLVTLYNKFWEQLFLGPGWSLPGESYERKVSGTNYSPCNCSWSEGCN